MASMPTSPHFYFTKNIFSGQEQCSHSDKWKNWKIFCDYVTNSCFPQVKNDHSREEAGEALMGGSNNIVFTRYPSVIFPLYTWSLLSLNCISWVYCVPKIKTVFYSSTYASWCVFTVKPVSSTRQLLVLKGTDISSLPLCISGIFIQSPSPCGLSVLCFCLMYVVAHLIPRDQCCSLTRTHSTWTVVCYIPGNKRPLSLIYSCVRWWFELCACRS